MLRTRVRAGAVAGLVMSLVFAALLTLRAVASTLFIPSLGARTSAQPTPVTLRVPYGAAHRRDAGRAPQPSSPTSTRASSCRAGRVLDDGNDDHRAAFAYESSRGGRPRARALVATFGIYFTALPRARRRTCAASGRTACACCARRSGSSRRWSASSSSAKALLLFTAAARVLDPGGGASRSGCALVVRPAHGVPRRTSCSPSSRRRSSASTSSLLTSCSSAGHRREPASSSSAKHPRQMVVAGARRRARWRAALYVGLAVVFEGRIDVLDGPDRARARLAPARLRRRRRWRGPPRARSCASRPSGCSGSVSRDKLLDLTDLEQPLLQKMAARGARDRGSTRARWPTSPRPRPRRSAPTRSSRASAPTTTTSARRFSPSTSSRTSRPGERSPHEELDPDVSRRRDHGARRAWGRRSSARAASPSRSWSSPTRTTARRSSSTSGTSARSRGTRRASREEHFRYPGMKPQTKETAILMLVDSIEAASRTI